MKVDPAPQKIGKYEIRGTLGRGAVGIVYKGYQADLDRHVAIKAMIAGEHASAGLIQRFLRESRAAASLVHPGIVQVHDVGTEDNLHYIVMEWVDGKPLDVLLKEGALDPRRALEIAADVARTLHEAHERGIIHRDVKPANILLDAKGHPKVADFGLAVSLEDERITQDGDFMGTAWYMSPEQAFESPDEIDRRADIYSLGAVLYEMLVGHPPFNEKRALAAIRSMDTETPAPPSQAREGLDPRLDAVVLKALEKDRNQRYSTMAEFAEAIGLALEGRHALAPRLRSRRRIVRFVMAGAAILALGFFTVHLFVDPVPSGLPERDKALGHGQTALNSPPGASRKAAIEALESFVSRHPKDGEACFMLSRLLAEAGHTRRGLDLASSALANGYDTAAARVHRLYLLFLRYPLLQGSIDLAYFRSKPPLEIAPELERIRALGGSEDDLRVADLLKSTFEGMHRRVVVQAADAPGPRAAALRGHAALQETLELPEPTRAEAAAKALKGLPNDRTSNAPLRFLGALFSGLTRTPPAVLADESFDAPDPHLYCGLELIRRGMSDRGIRHLNAAFQLDPGDPLPDLYAMALQVTPGQLKKIRKDFPALHAWAARDLPYPAATVLSGLAHLIEGNRKTAEETFKLARTRHGDPDSWPGEIRPALLKPLLASAGGSPVRFSYACLQALLELDPPAAAPVFEELVEMISRRDASARYRVEEAELERIRKAVFWQLALAAADRKEAERLQSPLKSFVAAGGAVADIQAEPRFRGLLADKFIRILTDEAARAAKAKSQGGKVRDAEGSEPKKNDD